MIQLKMTRLTLNITTYMNHHPIGCSPIIFSEQSGGVWRVTSLSEIVNPKAAERLECRLLRSITKL